MQKWVFKITRVVNPRFWDALISQNDFLKTDGYRKTWKLGRKLQADDMSSAKLSREVGG